MGIFSIFKPNVTKMEAKRDVKGLIKALKHKDEAVRRDAAEALGKIGDTRAVVPLIEALKDEHRWARWGAAEALGKIGDARAVEPLIEALKDKDSDVRKNAAEALGKIGDARAVVPLTEALKDEDSAVRWGAAKALGNMNWHPKDNTEKAYYLIAKEDWDSLDTLAKTGDESIVDPLIETLEVPEKWIYWKAADVLIKLGKKASENILRVPNFNRQITCLWILSKIEQNPKIIPDIINWLFANPRRYNYYYKDPYNDLYRAEDALKTLSIHSSLNDKIISLLIKASSFSTEFGIDGWENPVYAIQISATEKLCTINNPLTSNILYMISQKKDICVMLARAVCAGGGDWECKLSFAKQREIASEELKRRGFTKYDPSVYFK